MHRTRLLLIYLAAVFLLGPLIAPWLHWLAQLGASQVDSLRGIAEQPFHRFVNRSLLLVAVVGLWPLTRALHWRAFAEIGLPMPGRHWGALARGFGLGFGSLVVIVVVMLATGHRGLVLDRELPLILKHVATATFAAVIVAVLEEVCFRGVVFGTLRREWTLGLAVAASSALYSAVHFFSRAAHDGPVQWWSGLALLPRMCGGFFDLAALMPAFFSLVVAGSALAIAYQRSGNLYFSIGLHAGWIFWFKSFKFFTISKSTTAAWWWGTDRLLDGWLTCALLLGVLAVVVRTRILPRIPVVAHDTTSIPRGPRVG